MRGGLRPLSPFFHDPETKQTLTAHPDAVRQAYTTALSEFTERYRKEAAAMHIERALQRVGAHSKEKDVQITVHPGLAEYVFNTRGHRIERIEPAKDGIRIEERAASP